MKRTVETIDLTDSSTTLRTALMQVLDEEDVDGLEEDVTVDDEEVDEINTEDVENVDPHGEGDGDDILSGITVDSPEEDTDENISENETQRETLYFFQLDNITRGGAFRPKDESNDAENFPLEASGQIETITIVSDSDTFETTFILDDDKVIDGTSWSELNSISQELAHIGAYQRSEGDYVLSISDYPFNEVVDLSIAPESETTFSLIRVEIMIDEYSKGVKQ